MNHPYPVLKEVPDKRDLGSRINLLQCLALLPVAKEHAARKGLRPVLNRWNDIRKLPARELSLYKISCKICGPYLSVSPRVNHIGGHFGVEISSLTANCILCDIIRQCYLYFVGEESSKRNCKITYGRKFDVQLCFSEYENRHNSSSSEHIHIQLYSKETKNRRNPFRLSRETCLDPTSATLLSTIKGWIDECVVSHQQCASTATHHSFVPTRLIKLEKDHGGVVRLISPTESVCFVALSYRWGASKQSETNKDNVSSRYLQFSSSDLPQTLQDAIIMTRGLGFEYLWIDSICIVQDDEEDWVTEASKMADIYSGAQVVLAATHAQDSSAGFLHSRAKPLAIQPRKNGVKKFEIYARRIDNHDCYLETDLKNYPLFQRGWCMQERLLARRIIHFLPDEIHYECQVKQDCECGALPDPTLSQPDPSPFRLLMLTPNVDGDSGFYFGRMWARTVQEYSTLRLTYKKDTLPALSGMAQRLNHLKPGKYIAGLWERDIAYQLGWYRDMSHVETDFGTIGQGLALSQPSFSWIVSPGAVKFHNDFRGTYTSLCTMVEGNCRRATADLYGQIIDGSISLRGRCVSGPEMVSELKSTTMDIDWGTPIVYLDFGLTSTCADCCSHGHYEGLESVSDWSSITCFGLYFWTWDSEHQFVDALLLRRKPNDLEYVRIGLVSGLPKPWFDQQASERIVTIT